VKISARYDEVSSVNQSGQRVLYTAAVKIIVVAPDQNFKL